MERLTQLHDVERHKVNYLKLSISLKMRPFLSISTVNRVVKPKVNG